MPSVSLPARRNLAVRGRYQQLAEDAPFTQFLERKQGEARRRPVPPCCEKKVRVFRKTLSIDNSLEAGGQVVDEDSDNLKGYYWQAEAARNLAKVALQRPMSLNANSWQGQLLLGDIYRQRKDWVAAVSHYNAPAHLKPTSASA